MNDVTATIVIAIPLICLVCIALILLRCRYLLIEYKNLVELLKVEVDKIRNQ